MSKPVQAAELSQRRPGPVTCRNCGRLAKDAPPGEVWFMWRQKPFCPDCAKKLGVGL